MPELAEVEYYRRQWDAGANARITAVRLHDEKRIFRGTNLALLRQLPGQRLLSSESSGKQMLFRFSGRLWMGVHLGMTGRLSVGPSNYAPQKHDHLVIFQKSRALIFTDPRQFGRVRVDQGKEPPEWWSSIGPAVASPEFTVTGMSEFLKHHERLPIKAALLLQDGFPGIGNWMADEILWRGGIAPKRLSSSLSAAETAALWRQARFVAREAVRRISPDFGDPPRGWLIHERWTDQGICPKHKVPLKRESIAGRTTAWCPKCQG